MGPALMGPFFKEKKRKNGVNFRNALNLTNSYDLPPGGLKCIKQWLDFRQNSKYLIHGVFKNNLHLFRKSSFVTC